MEENSVEGGQEVLQRVGRKGGCQPGWSGKPGEKGKHSEEGSQPWGYLGRAFEARGQHGKTGDGSVT